MIEYYPPREKNTDSEVPNCFCFISFWALARWSQLVETNLHSFTLPETIIAPQKWWLENDFSTGKVTFQGLCWASGG